MKDCRTKELAVAFGVLLTFTLLAVWLSYSQASFLFILKPHLEDKKVRGNWSIDGSPLLLNMYSKATAFINNTKILIPSNDTKHSNLTDITYERIFLPGKDSLDVFISVRTSQSFHKSRLKLLLHTWLQTVDPKQVRLPTVAKAVSNWMETLLCIQVQINTDGSNDSYINAAKAAGVLASAVIFFTNLGKTENTECECWSQVVFSDWSKYPNMLYPMSVECFPQVFEWWYHTVKSHMQGDCVTF